MAFRIQLRRDTAIKWAVNNPVLLQAEIGYETDTTLLKIGDGTTNWNDLSYWNGNLAIEVGGTQVVQGAGTLNFTGGVTATGASGSVTLDFSGVGGLTGPTGPAASINVYSDTAGVTGATGIKFTGGGISVSANGLEAIVTVNPLNSQIYNNVVRYLIDDSVDGVPNDLSGNEKVTIMSSGNLYTGRNWTRSGTTLTISSNLHGLTQGNGVLVRNSTTSNSYGYFLVDTVVSANSFTIVVPDSGDTSGSALAYIPAFSIQSYDVGIDMVLNPPSSGNAQLMGVTVNTLLDDETYQVQINGGTISNGAGYNQSNYTMNIPVVSAVDMDNTPGSNLNASVTAVASGANDTFRATGLNNAGYYTIIKFVF
jgi:hypothetical protein